MSRRRYDEAAADRWRERTVVELLILGLGMSKMNQSRESSSGSKRRPKKKRK